MGVLDPEYSKPTPAPATASEGTTTIDETGESWSPSVKTSEREDQGQSIATRSANADATTLTGATAAPEEDPYEKWKRDRGYIKDNRHGPGYTRRDSPSSWESEETVRSHYEYVNRSQPPSFLENMEFGELKSRDPGLQENLWGGVYDGLTALGVKKSTAQFYANRLIGSASSGVTPADIVPGVSDAITVDEAKTAFDEGKWGKGIILTATLFPLFKIVRKGRKAVKAGEQTVAREVGNTSQNVADDASSAATRNVQPDGNFYSVFHEFKLDPSDLGKSDSVHFNRANANLDEVLKRNPEYAKELEKHFPGVTVAVSVKGGRKNPPGGVWHHDQRTGVLQLVPKTQHSDPSSIFWKTLHPGGKGGYSIWAIPAGAPPRK